MQQHSTRINIARTAEDPRIALHLQAIDLLGIAYYTDKCITLAVVSIGFALGLSLSIAAVVIIAVAVILCILYHCKMKQYADRKGTCP